MEITESTRDLISLSRSQVSELIVNLWRIKKRAVRDNCESVIVASDRTFDLLAEMGFQLDEMVGDIYREEMRVKVAHQEGTEGILRISECLSPAIYFSSEAQNELLKKAEVVVRGEG